jgi:hypothetical protein
MDEAHSRRRFRGFDFGRSERQLDRKRILLGGLLALAVTGFLGYLGTHSLRSAVTWLHHQPEYQIRFLDIQLREQPPAWFRGGKEAFLGQVRENAKESEILPVMELERARIELDFKQFPWVDAVLRVEYPPQGIIVHLAYKKPVAIIPFPPGEVVLLDCQGHVLPIDDVDTEKLGPLIRITGRGLAALIRPQSGHRVWTSSAPGAEGERLQRSVLAAARLAGFLHDPVRASDTRSLPALRVLAIYTTDPRGLFLQTAESNMILWGEAPGEETAGRPEAQEKWEILKKWAKTTQKRSLPAGDYWEFVRSELKAKETGRGRGDKF